MAGRKSGLPGAAMEDGMEIHPQMYEELGKLRQRLKEEGRQALQVTGLEGE